MHELESKQATAEATASASMFAMPLRRFPLRYRIFAVPTKNRFRPFSIRR